MKRMILRLQYERLNNAKHVSYHGVMIDLFEKFNPDVLEVRPYYDPYQSSYTEEVSVFDQVRKSGYTEEIYEQDRVRDGIFRGLCDAVKSNLRHFDVSKRSAAQNLELVLNHYGNLAHRPLDEETVEIEDLLRELHEKHTEFVEKLGLGDWLTQLDNENRKFKELVADRDFESAQRPTSKMKIVRKEVDSTFRALLNQFEALAMVRGAATYNEFFRELNAVTERYKNKV